VSKIEEQFRFYKEKKAKETKPVKSKKDGLVSIASYSTDTIVDSDYSINDTLYKDNAYGDSILRAKLNSDWILKQNTSNDKDSKYDYFYIRDINELSCGNGTKCAQFKEIKVRQYLPYSNCSSCTYNDNVIDFGPEATKNVSGNITVGLPWSVSWQFDPVDKNDIDISTSGGGTTDDITWRAFNAAWTGWEYTIEADPVRFQPGTAWSSYGTYAAINVENRAKVIYANTDYILNTDFNVRYDY
jgi:hypothetical protein